MLRSTEIEHNITRNCSLISISGSDPVAIYYWSVLRHVIKAVSILKKAAAARAKGKSDACYGTCENRHIVIAHWYNFLQLIFG